MTIASHWLPGFATVDRHGDRERPRSGVTCALSLNRGTPGTDLAASSFHARRSTHTPSGRRPPARRLSARPPATTDAGPDKAGEFWKQRTGSGELYRPIGTRLVRCPTGRGGRAVVGCPGPAA